MSGRPSRPAKPGIRVAVLDDNPHLRWDGRVYPANATFHRFLAALLDVPGRPVAEIVHCVPLQAAARAPRTLPLDPRLIVVGTAPFEGIAGYLLRAPLLLVRNLQTLKRAIHGADLLWLKLPASNAALAALIAAATGVPRFGYVVGSARAVAAAQRGRGIEGLAARLAGGAYDALGRAAIVGGGRALVVGEGLTDGQGVVSSLVEPEEVREVGSLGWPSQVGRVKIVWAGRLAAGKGLETLLDAMGWLRAQPPGGPTIELLVLGDGPERPALEGRAQRLGLGTSVDWRGYVADRAAYMDALAGADLLAFPSPAEGFPKVILDAMAVGLPIIAAPVGSLLACADAGLIEPVPAGEPARLAGAIRHLIANPSRAVELRAAGASFAAAHTRSAAAARLVARWREWFPSLPWP